MENTSKTSHSDFYQILEVSREASLDQIKKQYRKLTLYYHPDKSTGDEEKFSQINMAFKVLSNEKRRKKYDNSIGGTYDELTQVERDIEYHRNDEFMKHDEKGERVFDHDKFLASFQKSNETLDNKFVQSESRVDDLLLKRLNDRDSFLTETLDSTRDTSTDLNKLGGKDFNNAFNQAFNDLKKRNKELIETCDNDNDNTTDCIDNCFTPHMNTSGMGEEYSTGMIVQGEELNLNSVGFKKDEIQQSIKKIDTSVQLDETDWNTKITSNDFEKRMQERLQETNQLKQYKDDDFVVNHNPDLLSEQELIGTPLVGDSDDESEDFTG
jgi:curved DNA-binding protein CbpA